LPSEFLVISMNEPLLNAAQGAKCIRALSGVSISRSTYFRWLLSGRLESTRVGGRWYTNASAIRAMLAADEQRNRGSVKSRGAAAAARHESRMSGRRSA
jgi:hypothetical protein